MTASFTAYLPQSVGADTIAGVPICPQTTNWYWCWAASTQSLCKYYDVNFTKTIQEVAAVYTTNPNVCPPEAQLSTLLPQIVENNGSAIEMKTTWETGKMTWEEVKKASDENKPFIFVIEWAPNSYHCNVFCGYSATDSNNLCFMDPGSSTKKKWRTWTQVIGTKTIDNKGTWFGSCVVTSVTVTPITKEFALHKPKQWSFICRPDRNNPSVVSLVFNPFMSGSSVLKIVNATGECIHQSYVMIAAGSSYRVPVSLPAGLYLATCHPTNATTHALAGQAHFTVVK